MLLDFIPGMIVGLLFTCLGKTYFHLSHMGVPAKSWRALVRPDRAWISRGLIGIVFFAGFGGALVLDSWLTILTPGLHLTLQVLAGLAALVVMTYQGFAMAHSSAFALWSTGMMPMTSFIYAALVGTSLTLALGALGGLDSTALALARNAQALLVLASLVIVLSLLHGARFGSRGGRFSADLLLKGAYAKSFFGLVIGIGLVIPGLLAVLAPYTVIISIFAAGCVLVGFFAFRLLMFRAAVYEPIMNITDGLLRG
jgi:DMSO reductase anchor subunit